MSIAYSSGNHAAALALAASMRGIPAYIVVPSNAPACKVAAVKEYGGEQQRLQHSKLQTGGSAMQSSHMCTSVTVGSCSMRA